jgi:hypothetical protein
MTDQLVFLTTENSTANSSAYRFARPNVRPADPDTSHAAAAIDRRTQRAVVYRLLEQHPEGLTDWELTRMGGFPDTEKPGVGKRRQECGAIDTGLRRIPTGRRMPCAVWRLP